MEMDKFFQGLLCMPNNNYFLSAKCFYWCKTDGEKEDRGGVGSKGNNGSNGKGERSEIDRKSVV